MADVVCLGGPPCRRRSAKRAARLRSSAAPGRPPAALARGRSGRGARAPQRSEERRGPRPVFAPAVPALQRRVGVADASAEERPGAALARDDAGPRSAAREHQRRVRRRDRESRGQALQRPRGARTARPRRCRPTCWTAGRRRSERQRVEAMPRRRAGPARSEAERLISAGAAQTRLGSRGAARRVTGGRAGEVPLARAVLAPVPSSPRAPEPPWSPFRASLGGSFGVRFVLYGEVRSRLLTAFRL